MACPPPDRHAGAHSPKIVRQPIRPSVIRRHLRARPNRKRSSASSPPQRQQFHQIPAPGRAWEALRRSPPERKNWVLRYRASGSMAFQNEQEIAERLHPRLNALSPSGNDRFEISADSAGLRRRSREAVILRAAGAEI